MLAIRYLSIGPGIAAVGAAVLLATHYGSLPATAEQPTIREFRPAAQPFALDVTKIYPWAAGSAPVSTAGATKVTGFSDGAALLTAAALKTANQVGPLSFNLDSIRAITANQAAPGTNTATANFTTMDQWVTGIAGLASSTGAVGFTDNAVAYDPFVGTHAGVLQTNNNLGPAFFNLNVLKAIGLTQAVSGTVLPSGQPDNFSAVDIGRWSAGIPGVITQTGTTGFVTYQDFGNGPISDFRVGGLHTTTQIGGSTFDFNVLPAISTGIVPPSISFGLAPDMTAANTPFDVSSPPPAGTVQPFGGLPVPAAVVNATARQAAPAAPAEPAGVAPEIQPARISETEPEVAIPGVNGAPLAKTPKTGGAAVGSNPMDPFKPFKPVTDAITNGLNTLTGTKPTTGGSNAGDTGSSSNGG